jgi:GNAT superfamily N-acetyltransferase
MKNMKSTETTELEIRVATEQDTKVILSFIKGLAEYERLSHEVLVTEELLRDSLFGTNPEAEVIIAFEGDEPAGFALFFHNYSTFLGQKGLYLEDLFVNPDRRGHGIGKALLAQLAKIAVERNCGRLEWAVLDWNEPAINFYKSLNAKLMDEWRTFRVTGEALETLALGGNED